MTMSGIPPETVTPAMQEVFFKLKKVCPAANLTDLHPNGRLLSAEKIQALERGVLELIKAIPSHGRETPMRYSKKFIKEVFQIDIDRGGIISEFDEKTGKIKLFALYKTPGTDALPHSLVLGKGGFGKVKLMQDLHTGELSALKVVRKESQDFMAKLNDLQMLQDEARFLEMFNQGSSVVFTKMKAAEEEKADQQDKPNVVKYYLKLNLLHGYTLSRVLEAGILTREDRYNIAMHICNAVKLVHDNGVLHRDIKSSNIMYDPETKALNLFDFGLAKKMADVKSTLSYDDVGTLGYIASEIIKKKPGAYTTASDIYAVGRVFQDVFGIKEKVVYDKKTIRFGTRDPAVAAQISSLERDLLAELAKKMLNHVPSLRPSLETIALELQLIQAHLQNQAAFDKEYEFYQKALSLNYKIEDLNSLHLFDKIGDKPTLDAIPHQYGDRKKISLDNFKMLNMTLYYKLAVLQAYSEVANGPNIEALQKKYDAAVAKIPDILSKLKPEQLTQTLFGLIPLDRITATHIDVILEHQGRFFDFMSALPEDKRAAFLLNMNEDQLRKLKSHYNEYQAVLGLVSENTPTPMSQIISAYLITAENIKDLYYTKPAGQYGGVFSPTARSAETRRIYDKVMAPGLTSPERYFILKHYIDDPQNANESFHKTLIINYGKEAFQAFKEPIKVPSVVPASNTTPQKPR